jgi:3-carboxy-cis,cis-muconate cycloisomerase
MILSDMLASTKPMRDLFEPRASLQFMLDVEAGLAEAGAEIGLIPQEAAAAIASVCKADDIDIEQMAADGQLAGTIVIPLVKWLKSRLPAYADAVHKGGTSQDIIDTALVLQLREAVNLLTDDLTAMTRATAVMAMTHEDTKMAGRTLLQPALPISFGLKAAYWLAAIEDARRAINQAARDAFVLQCGGAAGTLDAVAEHPVEFMQGFGAALFLPVPGLPWHTRRGPLLRLASAICVGISVAGKIATDIALLMQAEIGELAEPAAPGRGGSSAMAHKRNPTLCIAARAAATRAPGLLASLFTAAGGQEHERAAGGWQAEAAIWPSLMFAASSAFAAMAEALGGLEVKDDAMTRNLANLPDGGTGAASILISRALDITSNK